TESQAAARIGSWERDVETGAGSWSQEHFRIVGLDPMPGAPSLLQYLELVHPDDRAAVSAAIASHMSGQDEFADEYRIVHPELGVRTLLVRGNFVPGDVATGRPARISGTTQDVTEERAAQVAQREVEERHRLLLA